MCVHGALEYVDVVSSQCISSIMAWKHHVDGQKQNKDYQFD